MRALILFAREPDARTSKTRLSPALSPEERAALTEAMAADLADAARAASRPRRARRLLVRPGACRGVYRRISAPVSARLSARGGNGVRSAAAVWALGC